MNRLMILSLAVIALFIQSCGNSGKDLAPDSSKSTMNDIPSWYMMNPVEEGKIFDSATEVSQDLQMAMDKAELKAMKNMSGKMSSKMKAVTSRVQEELGFGDDSEIIDTFRNTMEQLVNKTLEGVRVVEKKPVREGSLWRAYVLLSYDAADAAEQLMNEMKKAKAVQARKEHKAEIQEMRDMLNAEFQD